MLTWQTEKKQLWRFLRSKIPAANLCKPTLGTHSYLSSLPSHSPHLTIPCPCLDKLFESFTHLTGEPQVIPSAREWRWSKDPGPKGNMANILTFTVPDAACSSVDKLICLLEKVSALMGEVTNTTLQYFSKGSSDVTGFESTPIQNEIVHQKHRIYRVFLTGQESKG